jgi:hypothetical protein
MEKDAEKTETDVLFNHGVADRVGSCGMVP